MINDLEQDYIWREEKSTETFGIYKGEYLDAKYYVIEEKVDESKYYERTIMHFVPYDSYENVDVLFNELNLHDDLSLFDWDIEDYHLECFSLLESQYINDSHEKIKVVFNEFGDVDEMLLVLKDSQSVDYLVYEGYEDLLFEFEEDEMKTILLDEYNIDLYPKEKEYDKELFYFYLGLYYYFCIHNRE